MNPTILREQCDLPALFAGTGLPPDCGFEGCLKLGEYGSSRRGGSEVEASEFSHEGFPHSFAALFEDLGPDCELFGNRSVPPSPGCHVSQQWDKLYGCLGQAVNCLLLVSRVVRS